MICCQRKSSIGMLMKEKAKLYQEHVKFECILNKPCPRRKEENSILIQLEEQSQLRNKKERKIFEKKSGDIKGKEVISQKRVFP